MRGFDLDHRVAPGSPQCRIELRTISMGTFSGLGGPRLLRGMVKGVRHGKMPSFSHLYFDSEALPQSVRFETFASGIANFELSTPDEARFAARAHAWRVGDIVVSRISSTRLIYERTSVLIAASAVDHFYLNLHLRGAVLADCGDGRKQAGDGSLLVVDMRRPSRLDAVVEDEISLAIPRRKLATRLRGFDPHGLIAYGRMVPLLARTAEAVLASLPELDAAHGAEVEGLLVDLAAATLLDALRQRDMAASDNPLLAERARDWMEAHLAERFSIEGICADMGVSRASLYRALRGAGGALALLQRCRLRRFRALLEDPSEDRSIALLARECGFADRAHLARAFKKEFGLTPGAFRETATGDGRAPGGVQRRSASNKFADWVAGIS